MGRTGDENNVTMGFISPNFSKIPSHLILLPNKGYTFIRLGTPKGGLQPLRTGQGRRLRTLKFSMCIVSKLRRVKNILRKVRAAWVSKVYRKICCQTSNVYFSFKCKA